MNELIATQPTSITKPLREAGFVLSLYDDITQVATWWDNVHADRNIFLSVPYLKALQEAPPPQMQFYYVLVEREGRTCGIIYLQLDHFNAKASLNYNRNGVDGGKSKLKVKVRDFVAERIDFFTLICGNSMVTGSHGFLFDDSIPERQRIDLVHCALEWVRDYTMSLGYDVQLLFVKDFFDPLIPILRSCHRAPYYNEFKAQPGMTMDIRPEWKSFDDYLAALSSKYRVRVRRARKKISDIEIRSLSLEEVEELEPLIYSYYRAIADKAVFNLFVLNENYFSALKRHLGEQCRICGCFEDGKLVAFYSTLVNGDQVEAHFLGYHDTLNRERQLYLNMLYNIVDFAIKIEASSIFFARTALEIKSSVGAEPRDMYFYLQHNKGLHNKLLPHIYSLLDPVEEWLPRNPFRDARG